MDKPQPLEIADLPPALLAVEFARVLRDWLEPWEMAEVIRRNAAQPDPLVCHSHDFCDANMAMDEACRNITGIEDAVILCPERDDGVRDLALEALGERRTAVWSAAWDLAKANGFDVAKLEALASQENPR